ncbi:DUF2007 domain-containing protein [Algibacter mikhailovii]|uniref:DUF2007 domain-containing protein n=1 Tax=Algibacter mikhailovii TaxID=425498 RepID=A0A918V5B8_9FLAO|nr:DUF2007 domain-containing protein [Algibacter mikhailovii]GGZ70935.1 hypothetical protein GCM10007028_05180 [Algibacter mikhailovii]
MKDSNYVKIYTGELIIVQRMVAELEKIDIIPVLKDQTDSGLLPIFGTSNSLFKQVYIHKDELEKATDVINTFKSELQE